MSYDLYFKPRSGTLDPQRFLDYFSRRPNYKVDARQAWYQNGDTGVYFGFEMNDPKDEQFDDENPYHPVSLNINFCRPTYFVLEAEPEVTEFVRAFDMLVQDPQTHGMGEGEYDRQRLVSGWNHGNEFGYSAVLSEPRNRTGIASLPTSVLVDMWRWNLNRKTLQAQLGESRFVPTIRIILREGRPHTVAVWPDAIPIAAPQVDYFIVPRERLAPRRFLRRVADRALVAWNDAFPLLDKHRTAEFKDFVVLGYDRPPPEVRKFVESLLPDPSELEGIGLDRVLNRELVERALTPNPT